MPTLADAIGGKHRVIGGPFGSKLTQADYCVSGVPVIRGSNMPDVGRRVHGPYVHVSTEKFDRDFTSNTAFPGDIIVTQRGTLGQVGIIHPSSRHRKFVVSQSQMAIRVDERMACREFVYYFLTSPQFANYIASTTIQTGVPHINLGLLRDAPVEWPELKEQIEVASVLGAIDDKIELNWRMNETLEAMARAIFKDWFVDFGPTRAKLDGRSPYLAPDIWSLFPSRLDADANPEGWKREPLGKHMANFDSKRVPVSGGERARRQGPYPYHGATGVMDHVDAYLFDGTFLLVGEDGSVVKENGLAFTQYVWGKIWVNNHAHVLQGKGSVSTEQLLLYFQHEVVTPYITGAVQLKLSQGRMNSMPFLYAGADICEAFEALIAPFFEKYRINADESRTLVEMRDLLLPRLMSGEVHVRDAKGLVGETI